MFVFFDDRLLLHFLGLPERPMKRNQASLKVGNRVTGPAKGKEMLAREKHRNLANLINIQVSHISN